MVNETKCGTLKFNFTISIYEQKLEKTGQWLDIIGIQTQNTQFEEVLYLTIIKAPSGSGNKMKAFSNKKMLKVDIQPLIL